ncbi:MAG: aminotransferase class IV [Deltaproteobacteria bacterium]|nr:aminotransferase class IV [Deltaproteobacteria bacterium]
MKISLNINGKLVTAHHAKVSIFDHGFLYGDSVYETLLTYEGRPFLLDLHLDRLFRSSSALQIKPSWSRDKYKKEIQKTLAPLVKQNKKKVMSQLWGRQGPSEEGDTVSPTTETLQKKCIIRICLTRGVGPIGLDPELCSKPTNIIYTQEFKDYPKSFYTKGINIRLVSTQRNSPFALSPAIKSCNFLNNILAFIEAKNHHALEGVMLNFKGHVAEGTTSNIFVVKDGVLRTPPLSSGILEGLTRWVVFEICKKEKIKATECVVRPHDIFKADECFISSTTREVMPVTKCDGKKIGTGHVGRVTQKLIRCFQEYAQRALSCKL